MKGQPRSATESVGVTTPAIEDAPEQNPLLLEDVPTPTPTQLSPYVIRPGAQKAESKGEAGVIGDEDELGYKKKI